MSKDTDNSLFIDFSLSRFYQQLFTGMVSYEVLGNRIIKRIKTAHAFRRVEQVRELSRLLLSLPIKEYQLIAQYYLVWCKCRELKYHNRVLEEIIEHTQNYKTKALLSRAGFEIHNGRIDSAFYFYTEGLKANPSIYDYIELTRCIAVAKSIEGFHESALRDMERLIPIIKHAEPLVYYDFLNSYATELAETGQKQEARNISRIVLSSPFAHAYPEWQETGLGLGVIGCKDPHSYVSLKAMPEPQVKPETKPKKKEKPQPKSETRAGKVISFPRLKEAPQPQKPDRLSPQELAELTPGDMRELLLAAIKTGAIEESEYVKMMGMVGLLKIGPADKIIDLEDDELLDDIAIMWSRNIGPEEFVGFLSALRDCDDDLRRTDILDRLITKIFHETKECGLTEEEWRLRVERRLPKK